MMDRRRTHGAADIFRVVMILLILSLASAALARDRPKEVTSPWIGENVVLKYGIGEFDYEFFSQAKLGLGAYKTLIVTEFGNETPKPADEDDEDDAEDVRWTDVGKESQKILTEEIEKINKKSKTFSAVRAGAKDDPSGDLFLEGRIVEFNRGSRVARALAGWGAGAGVLTIELKLTDPSGKVVYALVQRQLATREWTDLRDVIKDFSEEFAKQIIKKQK